MYPLFETVCLRNGAILNEEWHQFRYENAYLTLYGKKSQERILADVIIPEKYCQGVYKLRISYDQSLKKVEFEKYISKDIVTLKTVEDNEIEYDLKYTNRDRLNYLYAKRDDCDDILIVRDGLITDSSYSNIVFYDGTEWLTPSTPLLRGTAREKLLKQGIVKEVRLGTEDIKKFVSFKLVNAMRSFDDISDTDIKNILF